MRPPGGDPIDALIAAIVYARAGELAAAEEHYAHAKDAMSRNAPVHFVDCGPLVVERLLKQADDLVSR